MNEAFEIRSGREELKEASLKEGGEGGASGKLLTALRRRTLRSLKGEGERTRGGGQGIVNQRAKRLWKEKRKLCGIEERSLGREQNGPYRLGKKRLEAESSIENRNEVIFLQYKIKLRGSEKE